MKLDSLNDYRPFKVTNNLNISNDDVFDDDDDDQTTISSSNTNAFDNNFYSYVENLREKSRQHLSTINLMQSGTKVTNHSSLGNGTTSFKNGRKSVGVCTFPNEGSKKIELECFYDQHETASQQQTVKSVSLLRERFESFNQPKKIQSQPLPMSSFSSTPSSSSSSSSATSPSSKVQGEIIKTTFLLNLDDNQVSVSSNCSTSSGIVSDMSSAAANAPTTALPTKTISKAFNPNQELRFLYELSPEEIKLRRFLNKHFSPCLTRNLEKFVYLKLVDANQFDEPLETFKFTFNYACCLLNRNFDYESEFRTSKIENEMELKPDYPDFEADDLKASVDDLFDKKMIHFYKAESFVKDSIDDNNQLGSKVRSDHIQQRR
jgi:hypothetical protein